MRASLDKIPRDIMYSFCQYGMGKVWNWGAEVGGNSWRTTGDIRRYLEKYDGDWF
jgi:alpha-galactosidase